MELFLLLWIVCGGFTAYVASQRGANGVLWMVLGVLFGPFALIAAFAAGPSARASDPVLINSTLYGPEVNHQRAPLPRGDPRTEALIAHLKSGRSAAAFQPPPPAPATKKCPECAEDVRAEARKCRFCGYQFDRYIRN